MEKTRFKLLKAPGGFYYRTQLNGKTYRVDSSEVIPGNYVAANYRVHGKRLVLFDIERVEAFESDFSNASTIKVSYWGADVETYMTDGGDRVALNVSEFGDWQTVAMRPEILLASFVSEKEKFTYDATRMEKAALLDFLKKDDKRVIRFFNLGYDGYFFLYLLEEMGYTQTIKREDYEEDPKMREKEYSILQNEVGKYFSISWKNGENITKLVDTYNIITGMSLDEALEVYDVRDYDGKPLRKLDSGEFSMAEWIQEDGKVKPEKVDYCETDALASLRLYDTFILDDKIQEHFNNKNNFLTIGGIAWKTFLKMTFNINDADANSASKKFKNYKPGRWLDKGLIAFKDAVGDWSIEHDQHFRKQLYRGGYNLLNNGYYNQIINDQMLHSDITSAYPWILTSDRLCGKLLREGTLEEIGFREDRFYIYDIVIHSARIKKDKFPYLITGRKSTYMDGDENYIYNLDHDTDLSVFDFELDRALEVYDNFSYTIKKVYECEVLDGKIFKPFVEHFFSKKEDEKESKSKRQIAKMMINSLTGKIGENPIRKVLAMDYDDKGILRTYHQDHMEDTVGNTKSVPLIASITSLLRDYIYSKAEEVGFENVALIATDCIIHMDTGFRFNEESKSRELGNISHEVMKKTILIGDKMYQYIDGNDELVTVANGIKKEVQKTLKFGDLRPGLKYTVLQKKKTEKGNLLVPVEKVINKRGGDYYEYRK